MQAIGREGCNWCPVTALGVRMRGRDRRRGKEGRRERQKEREGDRVDQDVRNGAGGVCG